MDLNRPILTNTRGESLTMNDILKALEAGCIQCGLENGLQDLREKGTSSQFGLICREVGAMLNDTKFLWNTPHTKVNGLNKQYILLLSKTYIELCITYDKRICLEYFLNFIGVNCLYLTQAEQRAYDNDSVLNALKPILSKNFNDADNELQLSRARDSKQSILNLAYNNYRHNWSGQIKEQSIVSTVKTLEDIKRERLEKSAERAQIDDNISLKAAQNPEKP